MMITYRPFSALAAGLCGCLGRSDGDRGLVLNRKPDVVVALPVVEEERRWLAVLVLRSVLLWALMMLF